MSVALAYFCSDTILEKDYKQVINMSQAGEKNEKARAQSGAQAQKRALGHMKNLNKFIGALDDYNSTVSKWCMS